VSGARRARPGGKHSPLANPPTEGNRTGLEKTAMKKLLVLSMILLLAAGCAGRQAKKPNAEARKKPAPALIKPAAELKPPAAAVCGKVRGTVTLNKFAQRHGNLFLFIIDQNKFPEQTVTIASAFYKRTQLTENDFSFEMGCVPEGTNSIVAVWDTALPYCDTKKPYCPASVKDGIGQSGQITVKNGNPVEDVKIDVF
jgi:hypothetical protein